MERIREGQLSFLRDVLRKQTLGNIVGLITDNRGLEKQSKNTNHMKTSANCYMSARWRSRKEQEIIGQSIYAKLWLNPPQIATEAFSSDLLPEMSPEKHIKNVEKSRRANIIFSAKSEMVVKNIIWSIIQ